MTTDIIELSKQVAEVLKVPETRDVWDENRLIPRPIWLAEDSGRCAEIAADKLIDTTHFSDKVRAHWIGKPFGLKKYDAYLADHNNERIKAYCVAVCRAVLEQAKQS